MQAYIQGSNTLETDQPQRNNSADYVIAQQYSSALVSVRLHCRKENFGARFEKRYGNFFTL
jgi:hypothetical protein